MLISRGRLTLFPCRHFILFLWICVATIHMSDYALTLSFLLLFGRETRHLAGMQRCQFAVYSWLSSSSSTLTLGPRRNSGQGKTMLLCNSSWCECERHKQSANTLATNRTCLCSRELFHQRIHVAKLSSDV